MNNLIKELRSIIYDICSKDMLNDQEALNFVDEVNKLSVSF